MTPLVPPRTVTGESGLLRVLLVASVLAIAGALLGLGLAMTLNIVKAHLGEIEVTSEVNKGTNFIITLPLAKDKLKHEPEKQSTYE